MSAMTPEERKKLFEETARSLWYTKCNGHVREDTNGESFEDDFLPNVYSYLGDDCYMKDRFVEQLKDFYDNN